MDIITFNICYLVLQSWILHNGYVPYVATTIPSPFMNVTYRIRLFTGFVTTQATHRVPYVEQDLLTLPEHLRSPLVFGGVRVVYFLVFYVVSCVLLFVCLSFFFSHGVVSLFSIHEFDCPFDIFRPSFTY